MAHSLFPISNHSQSSWGPADPVPALGGEESRETGFTREDQGPDLMGNLGISFALGIAISTQELLN